MRALLEGGVNVRASDDKQRTALHLAAAGGHEAIGGFLLLNSEMEASYSF